MEFSRLYENLSKWFPSPSECAGAYDIPVIAPTSEPDVTEWIPFNDLSKPFKATQGIHMFVDDYRMKRLWGATRQVSCDFGACRVRRIPGLLHLSGHARSAEHILPLHEALACGLLAIIRHQGNPYNLLGKQKDVQLVF